MPDAVIVSATRTAIGKAPNGALRTVRPDEMAATIIAEAVRRANDSPYGLAAYVFGRDLGRVFRVVEQLDYGVVGVNDGAPSTGQAPFGGRKLSGYGTEGGKYAFADYLDTKYVSLGL